MNKQLLAMAVAAAMFAPAVASADVKVFGRVQVEYNVEDSDSSDSVQSVDDDGGQSRIGVKFSEKLGGGMTAFGLLAWKIDPADHSTAGGGDALQARQQFVGLKSSWGSIAAGSFHAPYKTAGGVKWDPWTATHLQARRAGGMTGGPGIGGHNGFMRNSIYYTSPNVNGFKVQFAIAPDETADADTANDNEDSDNDYSLAVQYKNGPWHAIFAHNRNNNDEVNEDETLTKVGLRWKSGAWTLAGQYEDVSDADQSRRSKTPGLNVKYRPDNGGDMDLLWLNAQYKAGNNIFTASYGTMDIDNTDGTDADVDYWAVGAIHKFSKKTRIFGGYTETDGDNMFDDRDAWTVGIRHDF
jgi:predicted porin